MSYFVALSRSHGETVLSQYQALRSDRLLCDVVLVAEGTEFNAHRSLLACASDYFKSMFKGHTRESRQSVVHLHAVSAGGLRHVLDFIYNACLWLSPESLPQTLETASYLQVLEAVRLCSRYLLGSLSPASCCQAANIAARFALADARAGAEAYIAANLWRLLELGAEEAGLLELNPESLGAVLESEQVPRLREAALLSLALAWLGREPGRRQRLPHAGPLLSRIRYGLLSGAELEALCSGAGAGGEPLLQAAGPRELIAQALDYHSVESRQPLAQSSQSRLRVLDGQLVAVGGGRLHQASLGLVWALEPRTKRWRPVTRCEPLLHHCVCVLANFLFVLGGEAEEAGPKQPPPHQRRPPAAVSDRVHRYDPRLDRWSRLASMRSGRAQFSCCVLGGRIYALGGRCGPEVQGPAGASLPTVEAYDFAAGRWEAVAARLPHPLHGHASAVHGRTIYVSGGRYAEQAEASKDMHSLQPLDGEGRWAACPPMAIARFGHQMATVGERVFAFVGMYEPFCDIEYYDPALRHWQRLRPLLLDRSCYGLAVMDARVYLVGGKKWHNAQEVAAQSAVVYDTASDTWREVCKLPLPLCGTQCGVLQLLDLPEAEGKLGME
uniref:kelch-like protein 34 n=1 Tax=Pristiophorus japonicus TaxID=55135 RepID=UPI00398E88EE